MWALVSLFISCSSTTDPISQSPKPQKTKSQNPKLQTNPKLQKKPLKKIKRPPFPQRMANAIAESRQFLVYVDDMLGEGGWDPEPRVPDHEVNCMIWLQWVLAKAYETTDMPLADVLDAIRYFERGVSFGSRKHYIDRWVFLEPGPLKPLKGKICSHNQKLSISLRLDRLKKHWKYSCPLYQEKRRKFTVSYIAGKDLSDCVTRLKDGYYVLFPVAGKRYIELHSVAGVMGLVHSMILHLDGENSVLWHASIDFGEVVSEDPQDFWLRMSNLIRGFAIFELDPNWLPAEKKDVQEIQEIQSCEAKLPPKKNNH